MLFITRGRSDHDADVTHIESTVTHTLTARHTIALVFDVGVIVLDQAECATVLPGLQRFAEGQPQHEEGEPDHG